jgi:hypothetical protein
VRMRIASPTGQKLYERPVYTREHRADLAAK